MILAEQWQALDQQHVEITKAEFDSITFENLTDLHAHKGCLDVDKQTFLAEITKKKLVTLGKEKTDEKEKEKENDKQEKQKEKEKPKHVSASLWE